jgi:hypothetical protein
MAMEDGRWPVAGCQIDPSRKPENQKGRRDALRYFVI